MNDLLTECIAAFQDARGKIIDAIQTLYAVSDTEAWKDGYTSFSDFCESGLGISKSTGSQYLALYSRYAIEGGISLKQLRNVSPDKLYAAIKLNGTPEQQYSKALTLTRRELKEEHGDDVPHDHAWIEYCSICGIKHP